MVFQERTYSVLLVSAGEKFARTLSGLLPPTDFFPITTVRSADEARRRLLSTSYDLVLINAPLPDELGTRLAMDVCSGSEAGVLLLVGSELYREVCAQVTEYGVLTLSKPTSSQLLSHSLRALCAMRERLRRQGEKQATVEDKIQEIRLVNRAKWALIQHRGLTEEEAHRHIEKSAMDRRVSRREAAQRILDALS
jgi:AmiR/NasT family two-component response regulator